MNDSGILYKSKPQQNQNQTDNSFLKQLNTLNEKIKLYTSVFYNKSPRRLNYNSVLKNKNLTFTKFKQIRGN